MRKLLVTLAFSIFISTCSFLPAQTSEATIESNSADTIPVAQDASCGAQITGDQSSATASSEEQWIQLFNGKDLTGWTPKFRYSPYGENYGDAFRVKDGLLVVRYEGDAFKTYGERYGHLFYETPYSHYRLRVEYRFVGEQCKDGPGWALRNSGMMLHCEDPKGMGLDQDFPASIEVQLLGGNGKDERPTANLCTPGTHVHMNGKLFTTHCTQSTSKTYHGEQWVTAEVEVHGGELIKHFVNGEQVLEYTQPVLDPKDGRSKHAIAASKGNMEVTSGYIALQAESHPVEFRKVELLILDK